MTRNKPARQENEFCLRQQCLEAYKKELERVTQDNNYYNNMLSKDVANKLLNYKEIVNMKIHTENYIRHLNMKINRVSSHV